MHKPLRIALATTLWLLVSPIYAAAPSADDFLPPVQASTPEEQQQLTQVKGPVKEVPNPATGKTVVQGATAQDAINFVVNQHSVGVQEVALGSGIGRVSTGMDVYEVMPNPTATRINKRNAYVKAFLEAKKNLAENLKGLSNEGRNQVVKEMEQVTTAQADMSNSSTTQVEKIEQSVQALLKGFVVYSVADDTDTSTVYVSIVTSPKTLGKCNRVSANDLEANSVRDGLSQVLLEIQSGLIPPIGGKMIQVPATGEIAFVGFGSDVVRTHSNVAMQAKMRLNATKIALMRAKDALVGVIIGDDTSWKGKLDETTKRIVIEYEAGDNYGDAGPKKLAQKRDTFLNEQTTPEQFQSMRKGILPPGVTSKTFNSKDGAEVYAVAVYIPSSSKQASQAAEEMNQTQLITAPSSGTTAAPPAQDENSQRPPQTVAPGPTGTVSRDQDL